MSPFVRWLRHAQSERGMATTELAVMLPVLFVMAVIVVLAGTVAVQDAAVRHAADAASRAASLHSTSAGASAAAQTAAAANPGNCDTVTATVSHWAEPNPTTPGYVTVEVSCVRQLWLIAGTTQRTATASSSSVLEYWRSS